MKKFKFIGDPRHGGDGPAFVKLFGVVFPKGEEVVVRDDAAVVKLSTNNHFVSEDMTPRQALKALEPEISDGSDSSVRGMSRERAELIAEAQTLDLKVDGRWSDARIGEEISKAKIAKAG